MSPANLSMQSKEQATPVKDDADWFCVFCQKGPHHRGLGDLFGPYSVNFDVKACNMINDRAGPSVSKSTPSKGKGKAKNSLLVAKMEPPKSEIWFHEDCICWSSGVYLAGGIIKNMDEAIKESCVTVSNAPLSPPTFSNSFKSSFLQVCSKCGLSGANLACLHKSCSSRFHIICAKEQGL